MDGNSQSKADFPIAIERDRRPSAVGCPFPCRTKITLAILSLWPILTIAQGDALVKERDQVAAQCRQLARPLGLSNSQLEEAARQASSLAELANIRESCQRDLAAYATTAPSDSAAISRGHNLYTSQGCATCHGNDARGGEGGPSLLRSQRLLRDKNGETLAEVVLKGIPNTRMIGFQLTKAQLVDIAAFLHDAQIKHLESTRNENSVPAIGDAKAGEAYFAHNCIQCHDGLASLKGIGMKYPDLKSLQQQWLMPDDSLSKNVVIRGEDGSTYEGSILDADEFLITLRLFDGSSRTVERGTKGTNIRIADRLTSHRQLLQKYTDNDIHNVTAYLRTLKQPGLPDFMHGDKGYSASTSKAYLLSKLRADDILHPANGSWPTYSGDYSGRRYSALTQINQSNVRYLTLAWVTRLAPGLADQRHYAIKVGGEGKDDHLAIVPAEIRGSILEVQGVLYLSTPDNAWAVDARSGEILWNFRWKSRGGWHQFGSRGPAMYNDSILFETPDDYLVSLDARTGAERWHAQVASMEEQYFASVAPIVVGEHVLVGTGNTLNAPGFLESFDPENGHLQWRRYSVPMRQGDPGIDTWKDLDAARHGGGQVWIPGVYDPKSQLYIYGTGNPTPAYVAAARGNRDALFTCSLLAVNVNSGELVWYYQTSPNDTHDWDSAQTPILADIILGGRAREVAMTAARNGYFFVVERNTGTPLLTAKFSGPANWARANLNARGQPVRLPEKDGVPAGALVSNDNSGATNWQPASYSPDYGLFFVQAAESWALLYKTNSDAGGAYSMEGKEEVRLDSNAYLKAIDPRTGRVTWSVKYPSGKPFANGVLTTAGRLLVAGDTAGNLIARDPANGRPLWHARLGTVSNAPETYMLDSHQFILVAGGDSLYAFRLQ